MLLNEIARRPRPPQYFEDFISVVLYNEDSDEEVNALFKVGIDFSDGNNIDYIEVVKPFTINGISYKQGEIVDEEDFEPYAGKDWAKNDIIAAANIDMFNAGEEDYYDQKREMNRMK